MSVSHQLQSKTRETCVSKHSCAMNCFNLLIILPGRAWPTTTKKNAVKRSLYFDKLIICFGRTKRTSIFPVVIQQYSTIQKITLALRLGSGESKRDYYVYWPKVLTDQSEWSRFFRKLEILRTLKRTNLKQVIIHLSKLLKFIFRKSHYVMFGQRLEGTLPKYALSILSAIDYPVYWTSITILSSIGF